MLFSDHSHTTSALVSVPHGFALERLLAAEFVGGWALGSMDLRHVADGVWCGRSLFDGTETHVEIVPHPTLGLIDYAVGSADSRAALIYIRVTPGATLGHGSECCLVSMHAMRAKATNDDRWTRTCTAHETEILLIKTQLERAFAEANG